MHIPVVGFFSCYNSVRQEEFEDTKGVIRIRKPRKDRQYNGQNNKDKRSNKTATFCKVLNNNYCMYYLLN